MPRSSFRRDLADRQTDPGGRRWLFVPYDQLHCGIGPLAEEDPSELGIVLVESPAKAGRRPYHRQKLALVLANLRQFALEQAARGVAVRHVVSDGDYRQALQPLVEELGTLRCMVPAERELRMDLQALVEAHGIEYVPHDGWLSTRRQFEAAHRRGAPFRMDAFYRRVRRDSGVLMEGGKPLGGKFSFDAENRKPWRGEPRAPELLRFEPDAVTLEACELVAEQFSEHPGELDPGALPSTLDDAERAWQWAMVECLPHFGPYQDAMSTQSASLFHTRISPLLNLHRLLPARVVDDTLRLDIPLASREGFVRQILGWREFVRHVHEATDGFRDLPDDVTVDESRTAGGEVAAPTFLVGAEQPLPAAFWGTTSGMACLDRTVADVWQQGYGHHITRLMVLANLATLLDVSPRELCDWFWIAYLDAYDWVVEPNVLGMGTFAVGELMTTKPYVAGAAYIDRMGDYCGECAFDPKRDCPIRSLYWAFLGRHESQLAGNGRLNMPMASLRKREADLRRVDGAIFEHVIEQLHAGRPVIPDEMPG